MIKKTLVFSTLLICVLGINALAYEDINSDYEFYTQITVLSDEGIIDGYDDGSFKPDNPISRSEFAKMFCNALNITETTGLQFYDVPENHWAKSYIDALSSSNIIDGYDDGSFRPDEKILVKDAIKMLVCAKGLEQIAIDAGGYPHGYVKTASTYKLTENISFDINSDLTRAQAAVLLYNGKEMDFYILNDRVYGDYYNGYLHIGTYPQSWQGVPNDSEVFDVKPNVFRMSFPREVKITTNGIDYYTTIIEDGDHLSYLDLPNDKEYITNYSFDSVSGSFIAIDDLQTIAYSYDLKTWNDGTPPVLYDNIKTSAPEMSNLPLSSDSDKLISYNPDQTAIAVMEINDTIHADETYYAADYITHVCRNTYISKDGTSWTYVILPSNALYATGVYLNADGKSFVISCEVPLTENEKEYVDELEKEALSQGKIYDKPVSKTENYMIPFDEI